MNAPKHTPEPTEVPKDPLITMTSENEIVVNGVTYVAVDDDNLDSCEGCAFDKELREACDAVACAMEHRTDKRDVRWMRADSVDASANAPNLLGTLKKLRKHMAYIDEQVAAAIAKAEGGEK